MENKNIYLTKIFRILKSNELKNKDFISNNDIVINLIFSIFRYMFDNFKDETMLYDSYLSRYNLTNLYIDIDSFLIRSIKNIIINKGKI